MISRDDDELKSVWTVKSDTSMDLFIRADGSPMEFTGCTRGVDNNVIAEIRQNGGSFNTAKLAALQSKVR